MLVLRWVATFDTPERWAKLLARQADAYAHGEFMCVYDPVPFLQYPSVHAFFVGPVGAYVIAGLFCLGCVLANSISGEGTAQNYSGLWRRDQ